MNRPDPLVAQATTPIHGSAGNKPKRTIVLVACCGKKRDTQAPARDMYLSSLFKKSRQWAEQNSSLWFILSAKYGLVAPLDLIDPYDVTLNGAPRDVRDQWAARVAAQLRPYANDRIIVLAGENYCHGWQGNYPNVERPLQGLGIGEQLGWLTRENRKGISA